MKYQQIAITAGGVLLILIFFNLAPYKTWLNDRIMTFTEEIYDQVDNMGIEQRKIYRWGSAYVALQDIKVFLKKNNIDPKKTLLLLPPPSYYKKLVPGLLIPEPVVCYYFSGMKATTVDCKDVYEATGCILIRSGQFIYQTLKSKEDVEKVIQIYKENK